MTTATRPAVTAAPCRKCPFRAKFKGDDDYLRPGRRAEIVQSMLADGMFPCHETVDYASGEDGDDDLSNTVECAGAALVMLRAGRDTQMLRISERLGMVDIDELVERNAKIDLWTMREALDELDTDDDEDGTSGTCDVVNANCEAPAGYMIGGEVVHGTDKVDTVCPECGVFVCDACSDDNGACLNGMCSDTEKDDDDYDY